MTDTKLAERIEARAILNWEQDTRIGDYAKPAFDELTPQYQGRLRKQARRQLQMEARNG